MLLKRCEAKVTVFVLPIICLCWFDSKCPSPKSLPQFAVKMPFTTHFKWQKPSKSIHNKHKFNTKATCISGPLPLLRLIRRHAYTIFQRNDLLNCFPICMSDAFYMCLAIRILQQYVFFFWIVLANDDICIVDPIRWHSVHCVCA